VLERLEKFNGEALVELTPGEYTQLTGRAGRRGIDREGHAVVLWRPGTDPTAVAGLASRRTYPLVSSFRPTYNMAINLIARWGRQGALGLLESSFARFQDPAADLAPAFGRIGAVLEHYGYLGGNATDPVLGEGGQRLRGIYGERDLLAALAIDAGAFDGLDAAELAALAGLLAYRARNTAAGQPKLPTGPLESAAGILLGEWAGLRRLEEGHGLAPTPEPEFGLARPLYTWAGGGTLQEALAGTGLAAGDFVHWARRAADLLSQLATLGPMPPGLDGRCLAALGLVRRGAVARAGLAD
jgi:superfamily II RNA helicase